MAFKELYTFQKEDVEKAILQKSFLNGSDMGTGKTHTAIATALEWRNAVLKDRGYLLPILVVAPLNTFESWTNKLNEQAPKLTHTVIDRKNRDRFLVDLFNLKYDVYIMHWAAVRLVIDQLKKDRIIFSVVIGDEIHNIANRDIITTTTFKQIPTYYKYAASGTASGSKPWNLWSVLNWLYPDQFDNYWRFVTKFGCLKNKKLKSGDYKEFAGVKNTAVLQHIMEPYYVKHLKKRKCCEHHQEGVMPYLPEKNYEELHIDLNPEQRRIYSEMSKKMVAWLGEQRDTALIASVAVAKLARLMQITMATPIITSEIVTKLDAETQEFFDEVVDTVELTMPSGKMDAALEVIEGIEDSVVVFTSFKKAAYLFEKYLTEHGVTSKVLSGSTAERDRVVIQKQFRDKEFKVFIAVIAAAAEGMDGLQDVSSTAIFLNRSLSTHKNIQAEDRLHRGGQRNQVTIIDILARNTIDEERLDILNSSWESIKRILGIA